MAGKSKKSDSKARKNYAYKCAPGGKSTPGTWWRNKLKRIKRCNGFDNNIDARKYWEMCQKVHGPKGRPGKSTRKKAS